MIVDYLHVGKYNHIAAFGDCIIKCQTSLRPKAERGLAPELGITQLHPRSPASCTTSFFPFLLLFLGFSLLLALLLIADFEPALHFSILPPRTPSALGTLPSSMAPPPPANLPLIERLKALAQTLQYVLALSLA